MVPPHFQWMFLQETPAGCWCAAIWRFRFRHEGTPSSHPFIVGVSTINHPAFLGTPMTMETSIWLPFDWGQPFIHRLFCWVPSGFDEGFDSWPDRKTQPAGFPHSVTATAAMDDIFLGQGHFCPNFGIGSLRSLVLGDKKPYSVFTQWPFQEPKLEVPTIYKAYVRPI